VIATGHQRWLHDAAGIGTPPFYVHGVHADLPFEGLDAAELYFGNEVAPGFFAWAVPFGDGTARLGVLAPQGSRQLFERFIRTEPIRSRLGLDLSDGGMDRARAALHSRAIVQGMVTPSYADRVLAVGESAGQVKTTTAGGIYYGLLGARMAAERLDGALREDTLDAASLAPYEAAWRDRLGSEIRSGLELQERAAALSDEEIDRIFGALRDGVAAVIREVVRFDWHRPALRVLFRHRDLWRHFGDGSGGGSADAGEESAAATAARRRRRASRG
jgi:flavin-dependent dehydrogenase